MRYDPEKFDNDEDVLAHLAATSLRVQEGALTHANSAPDCEDDTYRSLGGLEAPPVEACLGSSVPSRAAFAQSLTSGITKALKPDPVVQAYVMETQPPALVCNSDRVDLNLKGIRKVALSVKKAGIPNFVGLIRIGHRPKSGSDIETYAALIGIAYGAELDATKMKLLQGDIQKQFSSGGIERVMRYSQVELTATGVAAAVARTCCLGDANSHTKATAKKAAKLGHASWKSERDLRDFLRFQALSSVQLKNLGVAVGDGQRLFERALVDAKHAMKKRVRKGNQVIHRDAIVQFHAAELVRLEMFEYRVPFLQIR